MNILGLCRDFSVEGWEFLSRGEFSVMPAERPDDMSAAETRNHSYFAHVIVDERRRAPRRISIERSDLHATHPRQALGLREFGIVTL